MVISHRHRYLYFVAPKCASATVRQSLRPYTDIGYPVTSGTPQHVTVRQFLASRQAALFRSDYFKFSFVRNPYDRLFSGYHQDRKVAAKNPKWARVKDPIFSAIGDDFNRYIVEHVRRARLQDDWEWICFWPMHAFAFLDGQCVLDFVGRAESLDESLAALASHLHLPIEKVPDANVFEPPAGGLKYLDRYDRATLEIVNDLYAEDFQRFGYERVDPARHPVRAPARGAEAA